MSKKPDAGDLGLYQAHYDVTVVKISLMSWKLIRFQIKKTKSVISAQNSFFEKSLFLYKIQ